MRAAFGKLTLETKYRAKRSLGNASVLRSESVVKFGECSANTSDVPNERELEEGDILLHVDERDHPLLAQEVADRFGKV